MRWKESGINYSRGTYALASHDVSACIYDTVEDVCLLGYKRQYPGVCYSQAIAENSTTGFSPTYPVCTSDYTPETLSYTSAMLVSGGTQGGITSFVVSGTNSVFSELLRKQDTSYNEWIIAKDLVKTDVFTDYVVGGYVEHFGTFLLDATTLTSNFSMVQLDSGYAVRLGNAYSTLFNLDVFGAAFIVQPDYYASEIMSSFDVYATAMVGSSYYTVTSGIGTAFGTVNPTVSGANPTSMCAGDLEPPFVTNIVPAKSSVLQAPSSSVSFDLVDAIGGVDKDTVYVTVSGDKSSFPEGNELVIAGVPQSPSVSFFGAPEKYSFLYTPSSDWAYNEIITVTVTGSDSKPEVDGAPFVCAGETTNVFNDEWEFKVYNNSGLSCTISGSPDIYPPYLYNVYPEKWSAHQPYDANINFYILDEHTGVDLSAIKIYINDAPVIENGVSIDSSASLSLVDHGYYFNYNNNGFDFDSRVVVRVIASDSYIVPNTLDITYYYDVIESTTLVVTDFYPDTGITFNPADIDTCITVYDTQYGVNAAETYIKINNSICASSYSSIAGVMELTAVSGIDYIENTSISGAHIYNTSLDGVDISGAAFSGGYITTGSGTSGGMYNFSAPYKNTPSGIIVSALYTQDVSVNDNNILSGNFVSTLVSGVNWDGKYNNSSVTNVEVYDVNAYNVTTSGTVISGTVGYRLCCHPSNDFAYDGTINIDITATNNNSEAPVISDKSYQLYYGYNIKNFDRTFLPSHDVTVYLNAANKESHINTLHYGFYFTTLNKVTNDLSASIVGIAPWEDFPASIYPQAPVHRYGETNTVEIYVEDFNGNSLGPYTFNYTITES